MCVECARSIGSGPYVEYLVPVTPRNRVTDNGAETAPFLRTISKLLRASRTPIDVFSHGRVEKVSRRLILDRESRVEGFRLYCP